MANKKTSAPKAKAKKVQPKKKALPGTAVGQSVELHKLPKKIGSKAELRQLKRDAPNAFHRTRLQRMAGDQLKAQRLAFARSKSPQPEAAAA